MRNHTPHQPRSQLAYFLKRWTWRFGLGVILAIGCGCVYERVVRDGWASLVAVSDSPSQVRQRKKKSVSAPSLVNKWAILIEQYDGSTGRRQAAQLVDRLHAGAHLPDLWIHQTPSHTLVCRGLYDRPNDIEAKNDLRQTRLVRLENDQSFASAQIVSLGPTTPGATSDWDLRQHSGMFSLQIGFYDDAFGPTFRQAAEKAAEALRTEGHQSYFYHGPHRSMVTVGLFSNDDFVQEGVQQVYGPRVRALQESFPHNLGNGRTIVEKMNGQMTGKQPSFLVRVY